VYFFGGKVEQKRHQKEIFEDSELKELKIEWDVLTNTPTKVSIDVSKNNNGQPILFPKHPVFMQTIPNKMHLPE
jgi:hypothetical protein